MSDFVWVVPDVVTVPAVAEAPALGQIDHVAAGLARLPEQWRASVNMIAALAVFLGRYNDLEQVLQDILNKTDINTANADAPSSTVGAQLDEIGDLVGQQRIGLTNDDFRRYCFARIRTNNSNGNIEDIIAIATLIINDATAQIKASSQGIATGIVRVLYPTSDALATILINFLRLAVSAGVRLILETEPVAHASMFAFSTGPGFGNAADSGQPTLTPYGATGATGGKMANARQ